MSGLNQTARLLQGTRPNPFPVSARQRFDPAAFVWQCHVLNVRNQARVAPGNAG